MPIFRPLWIKSHALPEHFLQQNTCAAISRQLGKLLVAHPIQFFIKAICLRMTARKTRSWCCVNPASITLPATHLQCAYNHHRDLPRAALLCRIRHWKIEYLSSVCHNSPAMSVLRFAPESRFCSRRPLSPFLNLSYCPQHGGDHRHHGPARSGSTRNIDTMPSLISSVSGGVVRWEWQPVLPHWVPFHFSQPSHKAILLNQVTAIFSGSTARIAGVSSRTLFRYF